MTENFIEVTNNTTSEYSFIDIDGSKSYTDLFFKTLPKLYTLDQFSKLIEVAGDEEAFLIAESDMLNK